VVTVDDVEVGRVRQVGLLAELRDTPGRVRAGAPPLGATAAAAVRAEWAHRDDARPPGPAGDAAPLAGVTVLEAAHFVAGPLAGSLLAELGARVIKLEPLAGDPFRRTGSQSVKFLLGKESISLDLKHPAAAAILDALIDRSDVFVHSFRPRVPDRLGMGYERLAARNPQLLYVCASAYGSRGPQRDRTAFHSTPTALSGAGIVQAGRGNPPVDDSFPDPGGALAVATAVLLALHARARTGRGQYVETTMLTSAGYVMSAETVSYAGRPPVEMPDGGQHGPNAYYRLYACAQGWLFLAAARDCDRMALRALVPELGGARDDAAVTAALAGTFARGPAAAWASRLADSGVPAVVVTGTGSEQWLADQHLLAPGESPAFGRFWRLPPKIRFDAAAAPPPGAPAALGEHSEPLLAELGWSAEDVAALVRDGVVGVPAPAATGRTGRQGSRTV
jgi:crotonobetainyl-CoA:carnitine CoA-transferase CaiB-like acyl-CoA transferase